MKLCRYAPLEHPLVQQFQRAIDSLTAALSPASARQYRAVARCFLIYLGDEHPAIRSLDQLRRDPHLLGWFVDALPQLGAGSLHRSSAASALHSARACLERADPDLAHLIRSEDIPRAPQRLPRALTAAGSVNSAGTAPPQ